MTPLINNSKYVNTDIVIAPVAPARPPKFVVVTSERDSSGTLINVNKPLLLSVTSAENSPTEVVPVPSPSSKAEILARVKARAASSNSNVVGMSNVTPNVFTVSPISESLSVKQEINGTDTTMESKPDALLEVSVSIGDSLLLESHTYEVLYEYHNIYIYIYIYIYI